MDADPTFGTCAACGQPSDGAYRCSACARKAEEGWQSGPTQTGATSSRRRPSAVIFPAAAAATALTEADRIGRVPPWLPALAVVALVGWLVYLLV